MKLKVSKIETLKRDFIQLAPGVALFAVVVESGSITTAAKTLGYSKSTVSKQLSALENRLDTQLLIRNSRHQSLTPVGAQLYELAKQQLSLGEQMLNEAGSWKKEPAGTLRITIAELALQKLAPVLSRFKRIYPEINIDIIIDDAKINFSKEKIDLGIRYGWPSEPNMVCRSIENYQAIIIASPEYLELNQDIQKPSDLASHSWVTPRPDIVDFDGREIESPTKKIHYLTVKPTLTINSALAIKELILAGCGIGFYPKENVRDELQRGTLVELFPNWNLKPTPTIYTTYTHRKALSYVARLFLDQILDESDS